jgi:Fic family protein
MRKTGSYITLGQTQYFIPDPLPPKDPPFTLSAEMLSLYGEAMLELGKLNEMASRLPNIDRFIKAYVIKEALLSSAIEGIHTTILDVFTQPLLETKASKDMQLVMNYGHALHTALTMIQKEGMPLTSRVLLKAHEALMNVGEGEKANPGNYRKQQVRVGDLIPPPPLEIPDLMSDLERFINEDMSLPPLIKAGLAHVQFEEIHPFLDGNGRIGRLLIILMLMENNLLSEPILYLSLYLKKHHAEYYQRLDEVRTQGNFEGWITYYLKAIKGSCIDAHKRAKDIEALGEDLKNLLFHDKRFSMAMRDLRLHALSILFCCPIISIGELSRQLSVAYNTAHRILRTFIKYGFLVKETQQKRHKLFRFKAYLDVLERNYDTL